MAETPEHMEAMYYAVAAARAALDGIADKYVTGNNFVYYEKGDKRKRVSPDCYVVLGVPAKARSSYMMWENGGRAPNVVWEFTSPKTARDDREEKFILYEQTLKVPEYFLFDPPNQYLKPRLQGYRLVSGAYQPIVPDANGRMTSRETGIVVFVDGELLRFIHPRTGMVIPTTAEAFEETARERLLREAADAVAERERDRREAAEAEVARLRAELERRAGAA